ncbi:lipid IV(A) 3-deoxy-D-manno-octulosonic acid transferase [Paludibacterium purpuratum]|uniref:3-deoxy-D-manno-octulosonic acid transferase n=1 Tax=Paludibacterium purpuratum TaxID=1144873 RepID=A0A4R7B025_9NEIS|nr:lipid IV(A) 3-deoxy-D-manno-octulosonic acid transferase [Paludibacterium purpuratum]TDR72480.1 3-deoxy-D-manno-octulosonic-acid transferase [Paludibacterium purpuratum]
MIWRALYSLLWRLATPLVRRYLRRRGKKTPAYLEYWDERFGRALNAKHQGAIWVHAVSVGETRAAMPLIQALQQQWPGVPLLITQMTPTGRACAEALYGEQAEIRYLPYDYPQGVHAFLQAYRPRFGVLMETELWPNLIAAAHEQSIPLFLANARLSEKSYRGYRRFAALIRPALRQLTAVAAQSKDDAERLAALGASDPQVCGNTKYDFTPPPAQALLGAEFKQRLGDRPIVVCASTRDGEEALILQAWRAHRPQALLVIVPRHPERFDEVAQLALANGFTLQRRSDQQPVLPETQVWLGDSMGEMFAYYHAADLVFIGGSLMPLGGQNLIEPASIGRPVLIGPSCFNFAEASQIAFECGAACQVSDSDRLVDLINQLLVDAPRRVAMGQAGLAFSKAHRGASQRIVELIASRLSIHE